MNQDIANIILYTVPLLFIMIFAYGYWYDPESNKIEKKYKVKFKIRNGKFKIDNLKRGVSIIGSAGSGKTESVVYNLLQHLSKYQFNGILHDYKDFELTEIAYPLFKSQDFKFYTIAFDQIHYKVNPIAPRYLPNEESVNAVSKVLIENLLEQNVSESNATTKFFTDAVEGLLSGLIWKLKTSYPQYCTLPHVIAVFQTMTTKKLVAFLKT